MAQWAHHSNYGSVPISIPKYLAQSEEGWDVQDTFPSPGFALILVDEAATAVIDLEMSRESIVHWNFSFIKKEKKKEKKLIELVLHIVIEANWMNFNH